VTTKNSPDGDMHSHELLLDSNYWFHCETH